MSKELESLFPELSSAPDLACRGLDELSGVLREQEVRARKDSQG